METLYKPYPFITDPKIKLAISFFIGLVCFLFLIIFKPFQLDQVTSTAFFLGFGFNATLSLLIHLFVLPLILPKLFDPERWTIFKQLGMLTSIILFIGIINHFYNSIIGAEFSPQYSAIVMILMTLAVGILPCFVLTFIIERIENQKNSSEALEFQLPKKKPASSSFTIKSLNLNESDLQLCQDSFLYAKSDNNYLEVYYINEGAVNKEIIRSSIKSFLDQANFPFIIRCHKSYIVNKSMIQSTEGNARSLFFILRHSEEEIPVSRSFDKSILVA